MKKMSESKRNSLILGIVALAVFLGLSVFFFFDKPGIPLGWLAGSVIAIVAYLTIVLSSYFLIDSQNQASRIGYVILFNVVRLLLYGGILTLSALCTFYWKNKWLNFWSTFAGVIPMPIILAIISLSNKIKTIKDKAEEKKDE